MSNIQEKVIEEFGEQWTKLTHNTGYYASLEMLEDHLGNLESIDLFKNQTVAEIGSGSGRIVNMLIAAQCKKVIAIEPSSAMTVLKENTKESEDKIVYLHETGENWEYPDLDLICSIGVLHHIHDPVPTVKNAYRNLKKGGKFIIWLYGKEGNELYLFIANILRSVTPKLPHLLLSSFVYCLIPMLTLYAFLCNYLPLPMKSYMLEHIAKLDFASKKITIYDQLNPTWAKYYTRDEAEALLRDHGFTDVRLFHRHGYSWTVIGTKS
ncbi:MAG: class I SAM-dependent methyltransferase [Proteobacteria bacterium]|nr:class I SAM-dependent methyltransferase [Pseudomonadota bacterium]